MNLQSPECNPRVAKQQVSIAAYTAVVIDLQCPVSFLGKGNLLDSLGDTHSNSPRNTSVSNDKHRQCLVLQVTETQDTNKV
jgi:hypothetical protein